MTAIGQSVRETLSGPRRAARATRVWAAILALGCLALLSVAAWLDTGASPNAGPDAVPDTSEPIAAHAGPRPDLAPDGSPRRGVMGYGRPTRSLGLPPCGFLQVFGRPCATCGMTRAFTHAAEADLLGAFDAQPMGAVLALATASTFWLALHTAVFGSRLASMAGGGLGRRFTIWGVVGLLAGWGYTLATWDG